MTKTKTTSAVQILERITGRDPKVRRAIEDHKLNSRVAEMILEARERAGLTQAQLAKLVGTTQSAISRLEDATYEGHSLTMLQKVAAALDHRVEVRLVKASKVAPSRRRGGATRRTATA
ncbi:MAG: helix-turn-helix transcriptional regulator [Planctomycetes bacterium]|nr:helix-turn-helix transcriptional regulator [Planctomycetota bacterium]